MNKPVNQSLINKNRLRPMRIVFVISALNAGGAQRVISLMANYWAASKHNISILTISDNSSFYDIDPKINIIKLGLDRNPASIISGLKANITRIKAIRRKLISVKPDIVISFLTQTNIISTLACKSHGIPIIISERVNPKKTSESTAWKTARRIIYRLSDVLIVQSKQAQEFFRNYKIRTEIILNPVKKISILPNKKEKLVLAAGRLTYQKGFDLLISAFAEVSSKDWKLVILGNGPERDNLSRLISDLGLESRIHLPGLVKDIDIFFSRASIFVLSSRFEGFPNVLCEAMAAGLPCISFNCNSGPADIIDQNLNGILVENGNKTELALAINNLTDNEARRIALGKKALKIAGMLNLNNIMRQWENIIFNIKSQKR
jgi:GalNAc-alpha-(1->4)-GalNAc-alpha-(1->3)-diNAcBac-PP-undecaprenol alpha-1,4-N-acetyl-D-galactosaminyltransferase